MTFSHYCLAATEVTTAKPTPADAAKRVILVHKEGKKLDGKNTWCTLTEPAATAREKNKLCLPASLKTKKDTRVYKQWKINPTDLIEDAAVASILSAAAKLENARCGGPQSAPEPTPVPKVGAIMCNALYSTCMWASAPCCAACMCRDSSWDDCKNIPTKCNGRFDLIIKRLVTKLDMARCELAYESQDDKNYYVAYFAVGAAQSITTTSAGAACQKNMSNFRPLPY
jgi:hypothetical protein